MSVFLDCKLKNGSFEEFIFLHALYYVAIILVVEKHLSNAVRVGRLQLQQVDLSVPYVKQNGRRVGLDLVELLIGE